MNYNEKVNILKGYIRFSNEIDTLEEMKVSFDTCGRIELLKSEQKKIISSIYDVKDDNERNVLLRKYVLGHELIDIAEKIGVSERQVSRIHSKAINDIIFY